MKLQFLSKIFFKRKRNYLKEKSLEQAKAEGYVTEEEFLRIRQMRSEEDLTSYLKEKGKVKK